MPSPSTALIIGASRGLGLALTKELNKRGTKVFATIRSEPKEGQFPAGVEVLTGIDVGAEEAGSQIVKSLKGAKLDLCVFVAGLLKAESFPDELKWKDQIDMYTVCAVAPVFIASALAKSSCFSSKATFAILTSEGGSIELRTASEGGGMFGHHGSKAASNMMVKLLSYEFRDKGVTVVGIHPGFLKTDMTKDGGMEDYYESGGAITPDDAAPPFLDFLKDFKLENTGQLWAPLGPSGIGNAKEVLGTNLPTPLRLPW